MIKILEKYPVQFCESKNKFYDLISPNDCAKLTEIQYANIHDLEVLFSLIPASFEKIKSLKAFERAGILKKAALLIRENANELAYVISSEGGKPLKDALVETERAAITIELAAEEALRMSGETIPMERSQSSLGHLSFTKREPIGPVLAISAFNHPLNLLAHQVGTAIASGCSVVLKPAPSTPICAFIFKEILEQSGLPENILFVVNTDIPGIEKLVSSPLFRFISFIGSSKIGWNLRKIIAPGTRLALEHGGVAPAIVRGDADVKEAANLLCKGSFYHAGQVCISTQRIFVHETIFEEFKQSFIQETIQLKTGDARLNNTDVGPLIRKEEISRLQKWIEEAKSLGAIIEIEGKISGEQEQFFSPTILSNVSRESLLMNEEAFGPVVCLNSYSDERELLAYLNQSPFVFESSLFTRDISAALKISDELSSMTIVINNHNAFRVDWMPFGGHYQAGLGMGGVKYAMEEMTRLKQVIIKY